MPLNMGKDVVFFIPSHTKQILHAQGFQHLEKLPIERLKATLQFNFVLAYLLGYLACMAALVYISQRTLQLGDTIEGGPLGLGPMHVISTHPDRDVHQAVQRFDAIVDELW